MVDTPDLKSVVRQGVPVRVRPAALFSNKATYKYWFSAKTLAVYQMTARILPNPAAPAQKTPASRLAGVFCAGAAGLGSIRAVI